ncbi:MAG: hypothetical protein VX223_01395 [Myxococcota bacterium]|nr:hypothetical protein [Myxococcota bacterium]
MNFNQNHRQFLLLTRTVLVLSTVGLLFAWGTKGIAAGASEPRYIAWLMTQGLSPYVDAWSTVSPAAIWLHALIGFVSDFDEVGLLVWVPFIVLAPAVGSALRTPSLLRIAGAFALVAVLGLVPLNLVTDSNLLAGVCLSGVLGSSRRVADAPDHFRASLYALFAGVMGGAAVLLVPWLLAILWILQVAWSWSLHRDFKGSGWYGVRRMLYASVMSLFGTMLVIGAAGIWLLNLDVWNGLQEGLQARYIADWGYQYVTPSLVLALGVAATFLTGVFCARSLRYQCVVGVIISSALVTGIILGDGASLLIAVPLVPFGWHVTASIEAGEPKNGPLGLLLTAAFAIVSVVWVNTAEGVTQDAQVPRAMDSVVQRMMEFEGTSNGSVLTNHREHELLMKARRLPGTPFLDASVVSETHSIESLRRLALNRVDQAHHNAPVWVVWNIQADERWNLLGRNPTLAVWVRSNCISANSDDSEYSAVYDLYYCGPNKDRLR